MKKAILILLLLNNLVFAQSQLLNKQSQVDSISIEVFKGDSILTRAKISSKPNVYNINHDDRYIVEFKSSPINIKELRKSKVPYAKQPVDVDHDRFSKDLTYIVNQNSKKTGLGKNQITKEFRIAINAVLLENADSIVIERIKKLPYVKKVYRDNKCKIVDDASNEVIHASETWNSLGLTGEGVVIAIIDTGIDSSHVELSGKVVGGYDFVNNDNDPFDDHGHGTHCAGISAANGPTLKGVAPDAKLMAVKVLNAGGSGYSSWVIAGIEYAVDPDGDPLTDDGADVISMSLGFFGGTPDDPQSIAVNNAYKNGVLCVVAAGNNGNEYFNVSSPGCADDALTVGAIENTGSIAYFSSFGPSVETYSVKPEVVAPGVNIRSTIPNNQYESMSGTSMATPHVAGAAALLLQQNPSLTPEMLKSLLVNSAKKNDVSDIWAYGNGCIDVFKAAQQKSIVAPGIINFGLVDNSLDTWNSSSSIKLFNQLNSSNNYTFEIEHSLPAGVNLSLSTTNLSLSAKDSTSLFINISVDKDVPFSSKKLPSYEGVVKVYSNVDTVLVPFTFIKGQIFQINYDFVPQFVLIHNNDDITKLIYPSSNSVPVLLPNDIYDIITYYSEVYFLNEGIDNSINSIVNISVRDAKNIVKFQGKDPHGKGVPTSDISNTVFMNKNSNIGLRLVRFVFGFGFQTEKLLSNISDNYRFELSPSALPTNTDKYNWYSFPFSISDVDSSMTMDVDFTKFRKINFNYNNIKNFGDSLFYTRGAWSLNVGGFWDQYDTQTPSAHYIDSSLIQAIYLQPLPYENYTIDKYKYQRVYSKPKFLNAGYFEGSMSDQVLQLPNFYINPDKDSLVLVKYFGGNELVLPIRNLGIDIPLGSSPISFQPSYSFSNGYFNYFEDIPFLRFSCFDFPICKIPFTISTIDNDILIDTLYNYYGFNNSMLKVALENKVHYYRLSYDKFWVNNRQGLFNVEIKFIPDSLGYLANFQNFTLLSDGCPTNIINNNCRNYLSFVFDNGVDTSKMDIQIRKLGESDWINMKIQTSNNYDYNCLIPDTLENDFYSIRYFYKLSDNNYNEQITEPAFYVTSNLENDSLALVDLFNNTKGQDWVNNTNWLTDNVSSWYGITVVGDRVTEINLSSNNLVGPIPYSLTKLSKLEKLTIDNNIIDVIPDFSGITSITQFRVSNNKLDFNNILPNVKIVNFTYSPQDSIGHEEKFVIEEGSDFNLVAIISDTINNYRWYKDNSEITEYQDSISLSIDNLSINDSGIYTYIVTHDSVPGLELTSHKIYLDVRKKWFEKLDSVISFASESPNGGSWIDFDNDGDDDLFTNSLGFGNHLYKNKFIEDGKLVFENITNAKFFKEYFNTTGASWGDYNNDGFADLFVSSNSDDNIFYKNINGSFYKIDEYNFLTRAQTEGYGNGSWVDFDNDGYLDLFLGYGAKNSELYRNNGDSTFVEVFENQLSSNNTETGSLWSDLNNDNKQDLLIFNSYFKNTGDGFENNNLYLIENNDYPTSFSSADFDNDGDIDVFVTKEDWSGRKNVSPMIYENINNELFQEITDSAIALYKANSYGNSWGDYDNDGDIDLFVCYGEEENALWKNLLQETGQKTFERNSFGTIGEHFGNSFGCSNSDINFDGSLDLFIANRNKFAGDNMGYNYILKNIPNGNSWINIKCRGTASNSLAIGSKVKVKAKINGKDCWQLREINSISGYASQNSYNVHFGLGDASTIDSLIIIWSSGYVWDTTNVQVNQFLTITEEGIFKINATVNNENFGLVNGTGLYNKDSLVVLKAKPFGGSYFVNWIENGTVVSTDTVYSFIATSPRTLVANFKSYFDEITEVTLIGTESGVLKWVDFDADGDLDISIMGHKYPDYLFKLYRNKGDEAFEVVSELNIPGLFAANFAWNDIDGDNLIDLLIMGATESSEYISKLYKNLGNGQFEKITEAELPGVYNGKCSLEDLNKDGLPDVILQGFDISGFPKLFIYQNLGKGIFQKVNHNIADSIYVANYVCEDLNKDGYLDILINTYDNSPSLRTYYNKGNFCFQRFDNNGIVSKSTTSIVVRDFNNDGKMDLVSSGYDKLNNVSTKVFYNQNDSLFIDDTSAILPYISMGGLTSCDVDNNGWTDIVISDYYLDKAPIYSNNGDSSFTVNSSLPKIDRGKISWGDYDNDGRIDAVLSRQIDGGYITKMYRQSVGKINSKPNSISSLTTTLNLNTVILNWDKTTDAETPQDGLSYNLYIYNVDSSKYVISPNAKVDGESNNGERFIAELGNVRYNSNGFVINLPKGNYKWSVQAIDGALEGGPFAVAQTFSVITCSIEGTVQPEYSGVISGAGNYANGEDVILVANPYAGATFINWTEDNVVVSTNDTLELTANRDRNLVANFQTSFCQQEFNLIANKLGDIDWVDFDGDGDLDLSFADRSGGIASHLIIYRNDGNEQFTLIEPSGIVADVIVNFCWTDFNGDNKLDLFITAYNSGNYNVSRYLGNGSAVFTKQDGDHFDPLTNNSICKIVDVNNDGFLDVFMSGSLPEDPNVRKTYLYINRFDNEFIRTEPLAVGYTDANAEWADFDNDGDLDLIIAGIGNYPIATYKNDGEGNLNLQDNTFGYWADCSFATADFNNDGWFDIVCSGRISSFEFKNKLLLNDGTGHFIEQELSDESARSNPDISTIDYDNDGFTDFYITGLSSDYSEKLTTIYKNVDGVSFVKQPGAIITPFANTRFSWGDYNSDGKIDLVMSGTIGSNYATKVYKNYTTSINTKPTKLINLSSTVNDQIVSFKWNKGSDAQTHQDALTYNLYIYNIESSKYVITPLAKIYNEADNGKRFISSPGVITYSSDGYSVELPKGNYKWSVQAIDGGLMGGDFAEEKNFIVNTTEINSSLSKELIEIFPNPTSEHIFINSEVECNLTVTDIVGKTCFECKINLGKNKLDLFYFRSGMYLFKFKYNNQNRIEKVIIY